MSELVKKDFCYSCIISWIRATLLWLSSVFDIAGHSRVPVKNTMSHQCCGVLFVTFAPATKKCLDLLTYLLLTTII